MDEKHHDDGMKNFMGHTGKLGGEDIIDIILRQPKTGTYLVEKIYYYLCGRNIGTPLRDELSEYFYQSGYHIGSLIKKMLLSNWFYHDDIIGNKIKSPIELIANVLRLTGARPSKFKFLNQLQIRLKQRLLYPPNVSGWRSGQDWIDISTLAERMKFGQSVLNRELIIRHVSPKTSDEGDEFEMKKFDRHLKFDFSLNTMKSYLNGRPGQEIEQLVGLLFTADDDHIQHVLNQLQKDLNERDLDIQGCLSALFSLPEYQVC